MYIGRGSHGGFPYVSRATISASARAVRDRPARTGFPRGVRPRSVRAWQPSAERTEFNGGGGHEPDQEPPAHGLAGMVSV